MGHKIQEIKPLNHLEAVQTRILLRTHFLLENFAKRSSLT